MTIHELDENRTSGPPQRSGEPWTDDDYQTLLQGCRAGLELSALSQRLQRSPNPVRERAKRMLPLDQRGVPGDRVLVQLRTNLLADPDYDWAHHLAATPPPRPIVNHVLPTPNYAGIPGLKDEELLAVAEALAQQRRPRAPDDHVGRALAREVAQRGLSDDLRRAAASHTRHRVEAFLERTGFPYHHPAYWAMDDGAEWIDDGVASPPDPPPDEDMYYDETPYDDMYHA